MDELVKQVAERTGISTEQSRQAVETVMNFIKSRLPAPIASQIDGILDSPIADNVVDQAFNSLGGLLGQKE